MIKIFKDNQVDEEVTIYFKLEQPDKNTIYLKACDMRGVPLPSGCMLRIDEDGLYVCNTVNDFIIQHTPFKYDKKHAGLYVEQ